MDTPWRALAVEYLLKRFAARDQMIILSGRRVGKTEEARRLLAKAEAEGLRVVHVKPEQDGGK